MSGVYACTRCGSLRADDYVCKVCGGEDFGDPEEVAEALYEERQADEERRLAEEAERLAEEEGEDEEADEEADEETDEEDGEEDEEEYECEECGDTFDSERGLNVHSRVHEED